MSFAADMLNIASTALFAAGNANLAVFIAYKPTFDSGYSTLLGNFNAGQFAVYTGTISYLNPWGVYNATSINISDDGYTQNANYLISLIRNSGSFTGWTSGVQKNTVENATSVYKDVATESLWALGGITNNSADAQLDLWELICIDAAPDNAERQRIEGYLAHKWGESGSLPSDHPYKSAPPRI
jgi:hypothetical protein